MQSVAATVALSQLMKDRLGKQRNATVAVGRVTATALDLGGYTSLPGCTYMWACTQGQRSRYKHNRTILKPTCTSTLALNWTDSAGQQSLLDWN